MFIQALENNELKNRYFAYVVDETVSPEDSLIDILPKIRESRFGFLPVVAKDHTLKGVLTTRAVEKRIADEVLTAKLRT